MEAASRPALEPLADLPVEEPFGLSGTASKGEGPHPSSPGPTGASVAAANTPTSASAGLRDSDEDLLAYGALLNMELETPLSPPNSASPASSAPVPQADYDSGLVP